MSKVYEVLALAMGLIGLGVVTYIAWELIRSPYVWIAPIAVLAFIGAKAWEAFKDLIGE